MALEFDLLTKNGVIMHDNVREKPKDTTSNVVLYTNKMQSNKICHRCGRAGHYSRNCRTPINGFPGALENSKKLKSKGKKPQTAS